jgi:ATP-dependent RNA circularization protein (DNA/RNA ligase family)
MISGNFQARPPHLLMLGNVTARQDKVLSRADTQRFLIKPVIIEEKVDGTNVGISFASNGDLLVQNRGNLVEPGTKGQFLPLWAWLKERESLLFDALEDQLILFGEWCYARHSIRYDRLPDFFLGFDVLDKREKRFFSSGRRNQLLSDLKLVTVPRIASGMFAFDDLARLVGSSHFYNGPMEGIYLRSEDEYWLCERAKVVRPEFIRGIGEHWSKKPLVANRLDRDQVRHYRAPFQTDSE